MKGLGPHTHKSMGARLDALSKELERPAKPLDVIIDFKQTFPSGTKIVSMIAHLGRVYVATERAVYRVEGDRLKLLKLEE